MVKVAATPIHRQALPLQASAGADDRSTTVVLISKCDHALLLFFIAAGMR